MHVRSASIYVYACVRTKRNFKLLNLGPKLSEVDEFIKLIKVPSDHPKSQRSLLYYNIFKANEYKSLIMYAFIFVLKPFMKKVFLKI